MSGAVSTLTGLIRGAIRDRGGTTCSRSACDDPGHQIDHHHPWRRGGPTDTANSDLGCGFHHRPEEAGYRPGWQPDGTYRLLRPDGTTITPPA